MFIASAPEEFLCHTNDASKSFNFIQIFFIKEQFLDRKSTTYICNLREEGQKIDFLNDILPKGKHLSTY